MLAGLAGANDAKLELLKPWFSSCGRCPIPVAFLGKQGLPFLLAYSSLAVFSHPTDKLKIISIELTLTSCFSRSCRNLPQLFPTALKLEMT